MTVDKKAEWKTPELQDIGSIGDVTLAVDNPGGGDSQFSVLDPLPS